MSATATKTQITPEQRLTVMKHLAGGKDLDTTATLTRLDRAEVLDIGSKHGYPSTEAMRRAVAILERNIDAAQALPERAPERVTPIRPAVDASTPSAAGLTKPDEIRVLLNTAKGHPSKRIQAQANKVIEAVDRLKSMLREDEEKHAEKRKADAERAAAKAEVERLEAQLRAAKERLRGPKPAAASKPQNGGSDAARIRAWARENGIDCPAVGRVPAAVRQAYDDGNPTAS